MDNLNVAELADEISARIDAVLSRYNLSLDGLLINAERGLPGTIEVIAVSQREGDDMPALLADAYNFRVAMLAEGVEIGSAKVETDNTEGVVYVRFEGEMD